MSVAAYAYAQARLQARHAQRPDLSDWQLLQGIGEPVLFLQVARRTRLRRWVLALQGEHDSHRIELILRQQFYDYIDEVLRWLPPHWAESASWLKRLPELPAIQQLLGGGQAPAWMHDDPRLRDFSRGDREQRLQALIRSECAPLVAAWQRGESPVQAWFSHWRSVWVTGHRELEQLTTLVQLYLRAAPADSGRNMEAQREYLFGRFTAMFRRATFRPAACYAHLALTALDLLILRAELLQRVLFSARRGQV